MSHKLGWFAAAPMNKGLAAALIAVVTVAMSAITPTRADTLTGVTLEELRARILSFLRMALK